MDAAVVPSVCDGALYASYTYTSPIPDGCVSKGSERISCVLGVDEAGRGPVLGPLVYGIAYCPEHAQEQLHEIGFAGALSTQLTADSKTLTAEKRDGLLAALLENNGTIGWAVRVMSPQDIAAGMLRRRPHNLNAQSSDSTVLLIREILDSGVDITKIFVDTVGEPNAYARLLRSHFPRHPHIEWTVTRKADAIYPVVGAASIAAKVTRDRCLENWTYAEPSLPSLPELGVPGDKRKRAEDSDAWETGSGYPGDPRTVQYLHQTLDPLFGWAGIVRFSWATAKTLLEARASGGGEDDALRTSLAGTPLPASSRAYSVRWIDEPATLTHFFSKGAVPQSTHAHSDALQKDRAASQKHRHAIWRDLALGTACAADLFM
ncbi:ribonuclease H [Malassezia vespertilionis]|uniref:ribonuclease H n=1 Tax=Malassezia vespertilionis TaxID=2020962 RepID=UPI0024B1FA09|nr:ribonuclease H [Malassezia vespertilionis]WFD08114.1 ribonuclease H [Malassezia vespertilionis]